MRSRHVSAWEEERFKARRNTFGTFAHAFAHAFALIALKVEAQTKPLGGGDPERPSTVPTLKVPVRTHSLVFNPAPP